MLRHRGIPYAEKRGEFADRTLAVDQLAQNQQAMAVGHRLEQITRDVGGGLHLFAIYFHACVYTQYRIYSQPQGGRRSPIPQQQGSIAVKEIKQAEEVSWRNSSYSVQALAER